MSKKIITALAPIAAIIAMMMVPSLAQATQAQCGSVECATNATIRLQSTNFQMLTQKPEFDIKCTADTLAGTLNASQAVTLEGPISSDLFSGCTAGGFTEDVTTNASAANWKLQIQQPDANGQVTAHLIPATGNTMRVTAQDQVFGASVATCTYAATSIQLMNTEQSDVFTLEGKEQMTLVESTSAELCGTVNTTKGDLSGSFQLENAAAEALVVHMTEKP